MLNFDAFIQNENEVTVLFYAEWFSPSLVLKEKLVSELAKEELLLIDLLIDNMAYVSILSSTRSGVILAVTTVL